MYGHFKTVPKRPKFCHSSAASSSHFLFPSDFSGTTADTDIVNTPEPLRPTDVPFGCYKTKTKDLGGIFTATPPTHSRPFRSQASLLTPTPFS